MLALPTSYRQVFPDSEWLGRRNAEETRPTLALFAPAPRTPPLPDFASKNQRSGSVDPSSYSTMTCAPAGGSSASHVGLLKPIQESAGQCGDRVREVARGHTS